jgi:phospholipid/cholesterol/gamma-HCH transport system permease protein
VSAAPVGPQPSDKSGPIAAPPATGPSFGKAVATGVRDAFHPLVKFVDVFGSHVLLAGRAMSWLPRRPYRLRNYLEAAEYIGFGSLPIILLVGMFTGMVMSLQMVFAFGQFSLESLSGAITGKALAIELAPVLTALMLAGRAGAGIATEIGTMRISEQIDALESMAVNPIQFLILPRVIAGMLVAPILTLLFFVIGMGGAYVVAVVWKGVDAGQFVSNIQGGQIMQANDVVQGLIKSLVFGYLVTLIGCFQGYFASGGGRGVGIGTTRAVVIASVTVLVSDYFLTNILLTIMPPVKGAL